MLHKSPPAFQIYARDILGNSALSVLTAEEFGCYMRIIMNLWVNGGSLPYNFKIIRKLLGFNKETKARSLFKNIRSFFYIKGRKIHSSYIDEQLQKSMAYRLKMQNLAQKSGNSQPDQVAYYAEHDMPTTPSPIPIPIPINNSNSMFDYDINAIVSKWNQVSKKKIQPGSQGFTQIQTLLLNPANPSGQYSQDDILSAIDNYSRALAVPNSPAWKYNLYNFLTKAFVKFLPGAFDIDNYTWKTEKKGLDSDAKSKNTHSEFKKSTKSLVSQKFSNS